MSQLLDKHFKLNRGFTMVELLIYMGIFMILLTAITTIFTSVVSVQLEAESYSSVQLDGRFLLNRFIYDIQRASTIISPTLGNQAQSLQLRINNATYTYTTDGSNNITITNGLGTDVLNSYDTSVSNLAFQQIGNVGGKNTVKISFTLTSRVISSGTSNTKSFQTTIGLR